MSKKPVQRVKHIPQRTCVGCRTVMAKRSLIRIVRTPEGVRVDPTGKAAGRGAYLHDNRACWERGLKGALAHALKTELTQDERERLEAFALSLPGDPVSD
ncbi:MAG: YlxR family protein [Chloroflexota bacterium]